MLTLSCGIYIFISTAIIIEGCSQYLMKINFFLSLHYDGKYIIVGNICSGQEILDEKVHLFLL